MDKRLTDKKSIDTIAAELCPGISKGREKVVKLIKMYKGGQYLLDNYDWLGYRKDRIRNRSGDRKSRIQPRKSKMLFRPSLAIRKPSDDEYKKWSESLLEITNILTSLEDDIRDTTEGRHAWKVKELKKRTTELYMLMSDVYRKIFEKAKEQIMLAGQVDETEIAEMLKLDISIIHDHLKKMSLELELIK